MRRNILQPERVAIDYSLSKPKELSIQRLMRRTPEPTWDFSKRNIYGNKINRFRNRARENIRRVKIFQDKEKITVITAVKIRINIFPVFPIGSP